MPEQGGQISVHRLPVINEMRNEIAEPLFSGLEQILHPTEISEEIATVREPVGKIGDEAAWRSRGQISVAVNGLLGHDQRFLRTIQIG